MVTGASPAYLDLVGASRARLSETFRRGLRPDPRELAGWEWRGTNLPATSALLGLRRFIKGFVQVDGVVSGYNVTVPGADLSSPWAGARRRDGRREWAPFAVKETDLGGSDGPGALLLDYSAVRKPEPGLARRLRDHLVEVEGEPGLLLGRAYVSVATKLLPVGWFVLERLGARPEEGAGGRS